MTCLSCEFFKYPEWEEAIRNHEKMPFRINDGCLKYRMPTLGIDVNVNLEQQLDSIGVSCRDFLPRE